MTIAVVDNGSLEPAAHLNLRRVAAGVSHRTGLTVHAVSWRHSDRIAPGELEDIPAHTLETWIRTSIKQGERDFVFVPFFVSPQGAIGTALYADLERVRQDVGGFEFVLTGGLGARDAIVTIATARMIETIEQRNLVEPAAIAVDHGGPSLISAEIRNELATRIREQLGIRVSRLAAASLEGAEYPHNYPLLAQQLGLPGYDRGDIVIAPLFLSPGRHAGPHGDIAATCHAAGSRQPALRCHITELIGTHPLAIEALADALTESIATRRRDRGA